MIFDPIILILCLKLLSNFYPNMSPYKLKISYITYSYVIVVFPFITCGLEKDQSQEEATV